MNTATASRRVAALCLAEGRPLSVELKGWAPDAAQTAGTGDLARALRQLGVDARSAALAAVCPPALQRADALISTLPAPAALRVPLVQTCLWFGFVGLIQSVVLAVLERKVLPVFHQMHRDYGTASLPWAEEAGALLGFGLAVLAGVALVAYLGPSWLPGWGRTLAQAREAALAAALAESNPPEAVWAQWVVKARALQRIQGAAAGADFRSIALEWGRQAEQQMARFVTAFRFAGFFVLTVAALAVTAGVYSASASLAVLR